MEEAEVQGKENDDQHDRRNRIESVRWLLIRFSLSLTFGSIQGSNRWAAPSYSTVSFAMAS